MSGRKTAKYEILETERCGISEQINWQMDEQTFKQYEKERKI